MRKYCIVFTYFILLSNFINAQVDISNLVNIDKRIPPSPNASSLGMYADAPVDLYTGIPKIEIPLYDIKIDDYTLPISLSYHSGGIKVEENASWVGLGWSLNAGGVVTRVVRGLPDELAEQGYTGGGGVVVNDIIALHNTVNCSDPTNVLANQYLNKLIMVAEGNMDATPDIYYYNFAGYTGKFVFDKDGVIHMLSGSNLEINVVRTNVYNSAFPDRMFSRPIISLIITTPDGIKYTFEAIEETHPQTKYNDGVKIYNYINNVSSKWSFSKTDRVKNPFYSAWYLTKIEFPDKPEPIVLTYTPETLYYPVNTYDVFYYKYEFNSNAGVFYGQDYITHSENENTIYGQRLSEISWNSGKIEFIPSTDYRNDINILSSNTSKGKYLTDIKIYQKKNPTNDYVLFKTYQFEHSYFYNPYSDVNQIGSYHFRLKLDKIRTIGQGGTTSPPYIFEYNTTSLPDKNSAEVDYWGYYNGSGAKTRKPNLYCLNKSYVNSSVNTLYSIYEPNTTNPYYQFNDGYNREPNETYAQANILTKIKYPTGGYVEYEYELNDFMLSSGISKKGGGLRLSKTILSNGSDHSIDIIKEYKYDDVTGLTSGRISQLPQFGKWNVEAAEVFNGESIENYHKYCTTLFSQSQSGLGSTHGSFIGYTQVTEITNGSGKTIYKFDFPATYNSTNDLWNNNTSDYAYVKPTVEPPCIRDDMAGYIPGYLGYISTSYDDFPFIQNPDVDWSRGYLVEENVFDKDNVLKKSVDYEYEIKYLQKVPEIIAGTYNIEKGLLFANSLFIDYVLLQSLSDGGIVAGEDVVYNGIAINIYLYMTDIRWGINYQVSSGIKNLKKKTEIIDGVTTIHEYSYFADELQASITSQKGFYNFLSSEKTILSNGKVLVTKYKRPLDYSLTSPTFINQMKNKHIISPVLEQLSFVDSKIVGGELVDYSLYGSSSNYLLPHKVYQIETSQPITESAFGENLSDLSFTQFNSSNSFYHEKAELNYNNYGKLININKKDDVKTALIWAHNNSMPTAKVDNADAAEVIYSSFEAADDGFNNSNKTNSISHSGNYSTKACHVYWGNNRKIILTAGKEYIVSFWTRKGTASVTDYSRIHIERISDSYDVTVYPNQSDWVYVENKIFIPANKGGEYTVYILVNGGNGTDMSKFHLVDDLRIYPADSKMITYTYDPLIGQTSIADVNDLQTKFSYDGLGRLEYIRDMDNNILNKNSYFYYVPVVNPCIENPMSFTSIIADGDEAIAQYYNAKRFVKFDWQGGTLPYTVNYKLYDYDNNLLVEGSMVKNIQSFLWFLDIVWITGKNHKVDIQIIDNNNCTLSKSVIIYNGTVTYY